MRKKTVALRVCLAVALCAMGYATPAAADDGPVGPSTVRPGGGPSLPQMFAPLDAFIRDATVVVAAEKAAPEGSPPPAGSVPAVPTRAPARAAPVARSYPRAFSSYDALVDYANGVAARQKDSDDRLAALATRDDANRAALATVFDPRARGGLLRSRTDVMDDATMNDITKQLASDDLAARQLVADGALVTTPASWQLPLLGEDTQDFGPTPYYFEPSLTYRGVYYAHFHTGTDIAAAWGTPIVAPARGLVVYAGMMGDGAEVVVIAHDSGLVSMYAHLENRVFPVAVRAGDTVEAGDHIGNVGLTGNTTGAHVHWSIWKDGELIDPLSLIAAR
jgi:murein DD-endopeptidase MepM/ murein hydrolase activator NlpD